MDLTLRTSAVGNGSGGHAHGGNRPLGETSPSFGYGSFNFEYRVPEVAGRVDIVSNAVDSNGNQVPPFTFHIDIGTNGLVELPPSSEYRFYSSTGNPIEPDHPERFWGTRELVDGLIELARTYHSMFPDHTLAYNDMNLPRGGLFDYRSDWTEPHCGHRGSNADLRTQDIPADRRRQVWRIAVDSGLKPYDETKTSSPHYHLSR